MKAKLIFFILCSLPALQAMGKADSIYMHSERVVGGKVVEVLPKTVTYTQGSSEALKILSRHAIRRIVFADDRDEFEGQVIEINGESDWEKVVVLETRPETTGLVYAAELSGTGGGKFIAAAQAEQEAMTSLKKAAARLKCPFIHVSSSKVKESGHVGRRMKVSAVGYRY